LREDKIMIKCVAYCRVSTNSKDQANSLENQITYFNREIKKQEDYELVGSYADKGITGTSLKRPQFEQMLYDAGLDIIEVKNNDGDTRNTFKKYVTVPSSSRKPIFDRILVKNTSRFARNILVEDILRDLKRNKVYVYFLDLDKSTENDEDITYIQIFQTFDERESRDKSKKVKFGIEEGVKKGIINANSRLYGYKYIQAENRLEIIEEEAEVIRKIFHLYEHNFGIRRIINYLTDNNILTRDGKPFCKNSVRKILTNEKYEGINARLKFDTGVVFNKNSYAKVKPKEMWDVKRSDKIPAIVSEEQFNKVQEILRSKINYKLQIGVYKGITELAGLMKCGKCSQSYVSNVDKGRRLYNCKTKKLKGTKQCDNKNISLSKLQGLLTSDMYINLRYATMTEMLVKFKELVDSKAEQINNVSYDKISDLERQLQEVSEEGARLRKAYIKGTITEKEFDEEKPPLNDRKAEIEQELKTLTTPKEELMQELHDIKKAMETMRSIKAKDEYTFEEITADIECITVYPNKLVIEFKSFINNEHLKLDCFRASIEYK
jgi:site-specific DNA recombinase